MLPGMTRKARGDMDPHASQPTSLIALFHSIWGNRQLIAQMAKREVAGRYRGSVMGIAWSFFNPLLMLTVYTFFFSVVFKARWIGGTGSKTEFALILFAGLMVFNFFAECINRAPTLILSNSNYVKKVVFPLEILPSVILVSALFHLAVSLGVWVLFFLVFFGLPPASVFLFPIVLLPLLLLTLGISWFIASLGVYLRDLSQIVGVVTTALMFLSPVFYPIAILPETVQPFVQLSPLTLTVEQWRNVLIWGKPNEWGKWFSHLVTSFGLLSFGFNWFQKTRKGFADVL